MQTLLLSARDWRQARRWAKALAKERGLSVSAMCSQLIHAALDLPQYQPKPDLSHLEGSAVQAAIEGANISDFKIRALLSLVEDLSKDT